MNEKQIITNPEKYKKHLHSLRHFKNSKFFPKVLEILKKHQYGKILEIGAGSGSLYEALSEKDNNLVLNYEALDLKNILFCHLKNKFTLFVKNLSYDEIPAKNESYDIIMSFEVIEHVNNPSHFISEVTRVLKKDGLLLISFPTGRSIFSRLKFLFKGDVCNFSKDNGHISFFTNAIQENLFRDFKLIDTFSPRFGIPYFQRILMPRAAILADKKMFIYVKK